MRNTQGAWDMGFRPDADLAETLAQVQVWCMIAGADPAGDDPALAQALEKARFCGGAGIILTETAKLADVVFPVTGLRRTRRHLYLGERRVQRFYPAVPARRIRKPIMRSLLNWQAHWDMPWKPGPASLVFNQIAQSSTSLRRS